MRRTNEVRTRAIPAGDASRSRSATCTQRRVSVIVETSHVYVPRIVAALMRRRVDVGGRTGGQLTAVVF